jgi:hypothetical protein
VMDGVLLTMAQECMLGKMEVLLVA